MGHYFINDKNLKSEIKKNIENINGVEFTFFTDNGVFSKRGLDYGTRVLLENFEFGDKKSFLDVGTGCGPIGIYIAKSNNTDIFGFGLKFNKNYPNYFNKVKDDWNNYFKNINIKLDSNVLIKSISSTQNNAEVLNDKE